LLFYEDNVKLMDLETATKYDQPLICAGDKPGYFNPLIRDGKIVASWQQDTYASLRTLTCIASGSSYQENDEGTWNNTDPGAVKEGIIRMGYPAAAGDLLINNFLRFGPPWQRNEFSAHLLPQTVVYPGMADFWSELSSQFQLDNVSEI
jgi:hypothetical protein